MTDLVLGIALIGAELDGESVGVSYMLRDSLPSGCGSFAFARQALGKDAFEVARLLVDGKDDAQRGLAAAVLSAACHKAPLDFCDDGADTPFGVTIRPGDKLALIGYMAPVAKQFAGKVAETVIFDRGRELAGHDDVTPCSLQKEILPTCDIVVVSGTSVINGTVEDLLATCSGARVRAYRHLYADVSRRICRFGRHEPCRHHVGSRREGGDLPHHRPRRRHHGKPRPAQQRLRAPPR